MPQDDDRLIVALLATPEATASTLFGMLDVLNSVGRDWDFLMTGVPGRSRVRSLIVAAKAGELVVANGVPIRPHHDFASCPRPDVICIPDLFITPEEEIGGRYSETIAWLTRRYGDGTILAAACSGAVLLAEAGLLDGQDATSHWGYCEALGRRYPHIRVHPARALVTSGEGQRIITSGGGTTWQDLALFLVARFFGAEEAIKLARIYLMDWHRHGQQPFAALSHSRQVEDRAIADCQAWIADHYAAPAPVASMAHRSGLTERSFKRRFAKVTGMSPLDYVHTLRLEEAKQMLETSDLPVEAIANEVGYEDASFFRRLFRRKVNLTPAEYRRRFGSVRRALQEAAVS